MQCLPHRIKHGDLISGASDFVVTSSSNNAYFSVDKSSGILRTETRLDYELHPLVLVNVRHAFHTRPNDLRHVQAIVQV